MTKEQLVGRLRIVEGDLAFGRYTAALQSLDVLIDEVKLGDPAPAAPRTPLFALPKGTKITIEMG